jgi:hypothetical protein
MSARRLSRFCLSLSFGFLPVAVLVARGGPPLPAKTEAPAGLAVDFTRQIRPILSEHCFACHGPDEGKRKAKLRLDTREGAFARLRGGASAFVPGKPAESEVFTRVTADDPAHVMPPAKTGRRLTGEQAALLRRWIEQGANWSEHWAFVPPRRPPLPAVKDAAWPRTPVDAFILARLEREGLRPSPEADRVTLLRRVTLDLTGLPPTPAEVDAFLADGSPGAYERAVDRLLASPRYGEHMARQWLDLARYGDTHGLHLDNYREMWPYRDWVIRVFNANVSYDRFLVEQLAGDLLPNPTLDQLVATGFNRCHVTTSEGGSIDEEVYVRNVVDQVDTNGTVLLGLTTGCARCHDHKFDPISQKDYYGLFAFFNSLDGSPLDGNAARPGPVVRVATAEQAAALAKAEERVAAARRRIAEAVAAVKYDDSADAQAKGWAALVAAALSADGAYRTLSAWVRAQRGLGAPALPKDILVLVKLDAAKQTEAQRKQLRDYFLARAYAPARATFEPLLREQTTAEKEREALDKQIPATLVFKELPQPRPAYVLNRGEYDRRGPQVQRATPAFLPPLPADAPRNRLGLARWLVAPGHPLTARVAVNRLWQQLFGTGLVKTAEDFGSQGEHPSHPELLDWLAVQFVDDGWDVKRMVRRLVTSAAYRQATRVTPDRLAKDPADRLLSRGPRYRLDAETIRDQALAAGGLLVERLGGPSVKPPQPPGLWEAVAYTGSNTARFTPDAGREKVHRRSLYTFWKRTAPPPQMTTFDAPSREACTARRERTDTPLQALLLMNETQYVEAGRALAERALREGGPTPEGRATHLFRLAAARKPDDRELAELLSAYRDHRAAFGRDAEAARRLIAVGETKPDASLDPAELAAWTMVANLVLNLDEVLNKG